MRGLKHFFADQIAVKGISPVRQWLSNLGYDQHLFNPESRVFTLTFHSSLKYSVVAKDASRTELDNMANYLVCMKDFEMNGPKSDFMHQPGAYQLFYSFSE